MDGFLPPVDQSSWFDYQRKRAEQFAQERIAQAGATAQDWQSRAQESISGLVPDWAQPQQAVADLPSPPPIPEPPPPPPPAPAPEPAPSPAPSTPVLSGLGDWASAARDRIAQVGQDIGQTAGAIGETVGGAASQLGTGAQGGLQGTMPTLDTPSDYQPETPWEEAGATAARVGRGVVEPITNPIARIQQASSGAAGGLQAVGVPQGLANVAGFGAGVLDVPGAVMGSSLQEAAQRAGIPGADVQGDVAETLTPFPGTRLGALTRLRTAGLIGGPLIGGTIGALTAPEDARAAGAARGAAQGLAIGPDVANLIGEVPGAVRAVPRAGRTARAVTGATAEALPDLVRSIPYRLSTLPEDASGIVTQTGQRLYHGTGSTFATPEPGRFDPMGLYGPGYYLTSEPRVAASYAGAGRQSVQPAVGRLERQIADATEELQSYRSGPLREIFPDAPARAQQAEADIRALEAQRDALLSRSAPQVRAVNAPPGLDLLDAEASVAPSELERVEQSIARNQDTDVSQLQIVDERLRALRQDLAQGRPVTGSDVWDALRPNDWRRTDANTFANQTLADAGFDGIRYSGGRIMPLADATGRPILHEATVVFPESLDKLTNALSGTPGGLVAPGQAGTGTGLGAALRAAAAPGAIGARAAETAGQRAFDIGSGVAGGVAGAATAQGEDGEAPTWQQRAVRGAEGAALGALAGPSLRALGRGVGAGTAEDVLGAAAGAARGEGRGQTPAGVTKLGGAVQTAQALPLLSPVSQAWNLASGAARTGQRFAQDSFGNLFRRNLGAQETLADLLAMGRAIPDAVKAAGGEIGSMTATGARGQGLTSGGLSSSTNPWLRALTLGARGNAGGDMFWRTLNEQGATARLAARRGVSPAQLRASDPAAAAAAAQRAGDFSSFVGPNSFVAEALTHLGQIANNPSERLPKRLAAGALASFAPYVRTPERILAAAGQIVTDPATQTYALGKALKAGDSDAAREAAGRLGIAVPLVALFVHDYFSGDLRGDPPPNPTERRRQEAQGARWNSWHGLPADRIGPVGQAATAVATALGAGERAAARGEHPADVGRDVVSATLKWTLSNSYLSDLSDFASEVGAGRGEPALEAQGVNVAARPLAAPASLVGAFDPYERQREGTGQELQYRAVPGGRFLLPERIDPATGQPLQRQGNPVTRYLFGSQGDVVSPEGRELNLYGINAPTFKAGDTYAGRAQTGGQARALQRASGSEVNRAVRETMQGADYRGADDAGKKQLLQDAMTRARREADIAVGSGVARDAKSQATAAWEAVPKYEGVTGTPDEVRRLNARISRAQSALAAAKKKGRTAEQAWIDAHPDDYQLTRRTDVDAARLKRQKQELEQRYGITLS